MRSPLKALSILLFVGLILPGCAEIQTRSPSHHQQKSVSGGENFFREGDKVFAQGHFDEAIILYKKATANGSVMDPQWGPTAFYKLALSYTKTNDLRRALPLLNRMAADSKDRKINLRAASLHVSISRKLSDPFEERKAFLEVLNAYEGLVPDDGSFAGLNGIVSEKTARSEIQSWISENGSTEKSSDVEMDWNLDWKRVEELKKWADQFQGREGGGYLAWKLAKLYDRQGYDRETLVWVQRYLQVYPRDEYADQARSLLSDVYKRGNVSSGSPEGNAELREGSRSSVGVLLPLSGKYGVYGESVLHGLECAAGIFSPCRGDLGLNLIVRDTRGDPNLAAKILEEFSQKPEIKIVIGPLPQVEVDQAVPLAEKAGLPLVALTQKPGIAKMGDYIFRNFLTVADQVGTIVDYACNEKRWRKLAILYPTGAVGEEYLRAFTEEVDRCGGKIVAQASYSEKGGTNFTEAVRQLKLSSSQQDVSETVSFQALFFPDVYRKVPAVVAALKFLNIQNVVLLGGAGWDNPGLVTPAVGSDLDGSILVDGFFAQASNFATRDFVATFREAYDNTPTLLEAYAYDTLRLVGEVLQNHPTVQREEIPRLLSQRKNFSGVTGNISFDEDGDARRKLFLLTVENSQIVEVK